MTSIIFARDLLQCSYSFEIEYQNNLFLIFILVSLLDWIIPTTSRLRQRQNANEHCSVIYLIDGNKKNSSVSDESDFSQKAINLVHLDYSSWIWYQATQGKNVNLLIVDLSLFSSLLRPKPFPNHLRLFLPSSSCQTNTSLSLSLSFLVIIIHLKSNQLSSVDQQHLWFLFSSHQLNILV